jgi:chaperonin cofactor prefoldin
VLDSVQAEVKALEAEQREGRATMDKLKASLYAKFGNAINLEE